MKLILATHNEHKVAELEAILRPLIPELEGLESAASLGLDEPLENAITFEGNALIKARAVAQAAGVPALADDSGIVVDVLGGAPGIFSARWSGAHGDDAANVALLLAQLADVPVEHRGAAFVSAAALVMPDGREFTQLGEVRGTLRFERSGNGGFGYDPIFQPEGFEVTAAELAPEQKNAISHRGRAFTAFAPVIRREVFGA
ncbi:XTP/dITP diphosphohydrolase [Arcanobacterium wilhelmae]|uniref:dITP/XTP pyrophosphatase n=1 Tax=Arcanobacterium wilhelmae TaxID=1803177 RepID=A0ABT9NCZ2_9ACTO|nr:RdgB/HAM1 family non-canonical purine NTP pyrophosphatase [Arcanobacterium wilhelmae]MDP9801594.1 XTP/dITP diphosphohydrolase [Arcanobacterium wilhelmae]WFN90917.1 RdgB/HAM1 family non-canonical purine NTP pyrophosphatase [Arcanobacterium wilhelmae]